MSFKVYSVCPLEVSIIYILTNHPAAFFYNKDLAKNETTINIFELHGVKNKNAEFNKMGLWNSNVGFNIPVVEKCVRRQNLNGITLKSVVLENSPFLMYNSSQSNWTGAMIEIVDILEKKLNFR